MGGVSVTLERQKTAFFSAPYLRDGKTPIARCADKDKFADLAAIDRPEVTVIVNPGGTNEKFDRAHLKAAHIEVSSDNLSIFDKLAKGEADLMITDATETLYQQKLHPGVLCAIHPDAPFDFSEKAYLLPRDVALKAFVDQWLHVSRRDRRAGRAQGEMAAVRPRASLRPPVRRMAAGRDGGHIGAARQVGCARQFFQGVRRHFARASASSVPASPARAAGRRGSAPAAGRGRGDAARRARTPARAASARPPGRGSGRGRRRL